jgi:hypothetical protein
VFFAVSPGRCLRAHLESLKRVIPAQEHKCAVARLVRSCVFRVTSRHAESVRR